MLEEDVKDVFVTVISDLSGLDMDAFFVVLDNRGWMHPFDENGRRRDYDAIPKTMAELVDDPYRSIAGEFAPARRLRQGHDAVQRIFVGGFSAPAD